MTRAAALAAALTLLAALAGCAPDAVPRTVTVRADSTLGPVLTAVTPAVVAARPGLSVRLDTSAAGPADVVVSMDVLGSEPAGLALAQATLVVVARAGADPAPTLNAALEPARTIGVARSGAVARLAARALAAVSAEVAARVVPFPTTQAALDSVASRATDVAFALAPAALASNGYAVVYRPPGSAATTAVVTGTLHPGASADAQAVLDALAAPTAYRAWAAAGFRPPPARP